MLSAVERWLADPSRPTPTPLELADYVLRRGEVDYDSKPPQHDYLRRAGLALAHAMKQSS